MSFDIREYVAFDAKGRGYCPSCERKKGHRPSQKSLAVLASGAYKCHAGCTPEEIRNAVGYVPVAHTCEVPKMSEATQTYTESQVGKFVGLLLGGSTPDAVAAREWLKNRGITGDVIAHYQLGLMYAGISIPIPTGRGDFYVKRRVNPWGGEKSWTQKGIPAMVFFTHQPDSAVKTYLCEGEWDALLLGWLLREDPTIAVATFTCGCQTIPSEGYLEQLPGEVVIFYDRDEAGERGAKKLAQRLGNRAKIATVPAPSNYRQGWDVSDALNGGFTVNDIHRAAQQAQVVELPTAGEVTFTMAMQKVGDILTRYEQAAQQRWYLGALAKQWGRPVGALLEMYQTHHLEAQPQPTLDVHQFLQQKQAERQWLIAGFLPLATTALLVADGGAGKTLLAYDLVKAIATGQTWNGFPVRQAKCLILQTDEPEMDTQERLTIGGYDQIPTGRVFIKTSWQCSQMNWLKEWLHRERPGLVVIDSLTSSNRFSETEENDSSYGRSLYQLRDLANEYHCTFLVLHHTNKLGGARGSTAIRNNVSEVWHLKKLEERPPTLRLLEIEKSRSGVSGFHEIELNPDDYSWRYRGELHDLAGGLKAKLLTYLMEHPNTPFEPAELVELIGGTKDAVRMQLERLKRRGMVTAQQRSRTVQTGANRSRPQNYKVYLYPQNHGTGDGGCVQEFCSAKEILDPEPVPFAEQNAVHEGVVQQCVQHWNPDGDVAEQITGDDTPTHTKPPPRDISVGDVCRYCGPPGGVNVSCWGRDLQVLDIRGDTATVKAPSWIQPLTLPIHHLRKLRSHQ